MVPRFVSVKTNLTDLDKIKRASPSAVHVAAASPILRLIALLGASLGAILALGGIYIAVRGALADTRINLFGNAFSSTNVGVSMAFIGAVLGIVTFRRVLGSVDRLVGLPQGRGQSRADSSANIPSWPAEISLEALKRKLVRLSKTNSKILGAVASAERQGIYISELSNETGVDRDDLVYQGKELQTDRLIEILPLTDLNFRLHGDVLKLLGNKPALLLAAI